ncbi:hypothetical protein C9374_005750 [Naegleria lovaniensis]|uniref:Coatomer subunit beta' n=1 Tax=Naegleria lovaniensis TaxID=51637 RepID=A0AA88GPT9_NAELO|nr:uncharacterized protein C9374_005750 [Naegleria lovaniensis]KAG2381958.1 hypothetical protein C9374_005750 [Naegleria lovaniensis]
MNRLDIKEKLIARSEHRVKSVDLHPTEPWLLSSYYNGNVTIHDISTKQIIKSFDVTDLPVRCAKFIPRKRWIVCGSDDHAIRVFNYNTMEKEREFEAHDDYIRSIAVHPTKPYILTCSDDMSIRLWDWEDKWRCVRKFEGHTHYVMHVVFNPKDPNIFASCSLDGLVRMWNIHTEQPNFTLQGHEKGINYIDFYHGVDKPFLISASDDMVAKVWDYQTKHCVQALDSHAHNVTTCCFHPKLPIIITASEDFTVNIYNSQTFKLIKTLNYNLERVWGMAYTHEDSRLALACDLGSVVLRLSKDTPVVAMDKKGKVTYALNNEVQQMTIKEPLSAGGTGTTGIFGTTGTVTGTTGTSTGTTSTTTTSTTSQLSERLTNIPTKDMGCIDIYPESMEYDPKGHFISAVGGGDYVIYAAVSMRSKTYGNGEELVWSSVSSGCYAVRCKNNEIKIYKDFKEHKVFKPFFTPKQIFGGQLLGISSKDFICFYDWDSCQMIRNIGVSPRKVYWSDDNVANSAVLLATDNEFYILRYDALLVKNSLKNKMSQEEDSQIEDSLILEYNVDEKIREGQWVGETFIYTNNDARLNYVIGGQVTTITHLENAKHFFLGYVAKHNRIYIMDKDRNILSFRLYIQVLQYESSILRGDLDQASLLLPQIPQEEYNRLAKFLDAQGYKELAMQVTRDDEHKFEIALQLNDLNKAYEIIKVSKSALETKWKQLGQLALSQSNIKLAQECFTHGNDYGGLLLLYTSTGDVEGMKQLAELCLHNKHHVGYNNIAFMCFYLLGQVDSCLDLLIETNRLPEAALFARTFAPSQVSRVVQLWRSDLTGVNINSGGGVSGVGSIGSGGSVGSVGSIGSSIGSGVGGSIGTKVGTLRSELSSQRLKSIAESLADPSDYSNLFPNFEDALEIEKYLRENYYQQTFDSTLYSQVKQTMFGSDGNGVNWIEQYKQGGGEQFVITLPSNNNNNKEHDE